MRCGETSPLVNGDKRAAIAAAMPWPQRLLSTCLLACSPACAQVFAGTDAAGTVVLSNHSSDVAHELLIAAEPAPADATTALPPRRAGPSAPREPVVPQELVRAIEDAARRHTLPPGLLKAVISVESRFDPRAVSAKGAKGLMQLMPLTAQRFGVRDVFSIAENLNAGAAYLRELITRYEGDLTLALAAYNAGEGAVMRAGRQVPAFVETQQYVAKVLAHAGQPTSRPLP
jgi:soluble lytic murein transglycosylase-like protein